MTDARVTRIRILVNTFITLILVFAFTYFPYLSYQKESIENKAMNDITITKVIAYLFLVETIALSLAVYLLLRRLNMQPQDNEGLESS